MSNTIDIQPWPEQCSLAPAMNPVVYVDGCLCPYLIVNEISLAGNPAFSSAELCYSEAAVPGNNINEIDIVNTLAVGRRISICQVYDKGVGQSISDVAGLFEGTIECVERQMDGKGCVIKVTASDFSTRLDCAAVHGQRVYVSEDDTLFVDGFETVFNLDSAGNCCSESITHEGKNYHVFSSSDDNGKMWSLAEITLYLLSEYLPLGQIEIPSLSQLEAIMAYRFADELDVEGYSLLEALEKICEQGHLQFRFVSRLGNEGASVGIVFYRPGQGRSVELNIQRKGEALDISRTNIYKYNSNRCWPVANRYVGKGEMKVFEATFDLIRAWDPALEGGVYEDYSTTSSSFEMVQDVYRKWCLNEAGDYTFLPYDQGQPFDFTRVFESSEYLNRRRSFYESLSYNSDGKSVGYYLEVSYNAGQNWEEYSGQFQVLKDQCGIWLSTGELGTSMWNALQAGDFKIRITASVESDERLTCEYSDGPVNSTTDVEEHILSSDSFEYRKISCDSVFVNSIYGADETDDTVGLMGYIRQKSLNKTSIVEEVTIHTPYIMSGYQPGDRVVSASESRDLMDVRNDGRCKLWIDMVTMDFNSQSTELKMIKSYILS